jgi:DNA-binding response OmpR family regulator
MTDHTSSPTPEHAGNATILVVEDDLPIAQMMADVLEASGYRAIHAETGQAAREQMAAAQPDLVILDLILPDVDGLVLCAALKATSDVPILVSSGTARKRDAVLALKLGADDFMAKPFDIYEFEARVGALLRNRARRRSLGSGGSPSSAHLGLAS